MNGEISTCTETAPPAPAEVSPSHKSPSAERPCTLPLPNLLLTPDPFTTDTESPFESALDRRHVVDVLSDHGGNGWNVSHNRISQLLTQVVGEELAKFGVDANGDHDQDRDGGRRRERERHSRLKTRKSPRGNNKDKDNIVNGLHRKVEARLSCGSVVRIPFIIRETCKFIRERINDEGILRKSGSSSRVACIMQRFLCPDNEEYFSTFDTVHDVANVLKQYLRELETPLIPYNFQSVFIRCLELPESCRVDAILLASCLLPVETVGVLSYVMEFLGEVASSSKDNLMGCENLAIVMGPNIMPVLVDPRRSHGHGHGHGHGEKEKERAKEKDHSYNQHQQSERNILNKHNKVVEVLISNGSNVGFISSEIERKLDTYNSLRSSEDELENEGVGRRKKRRSGSLNRVLGFLKKVTGKSGMETPSAGGGGLASTPGDSFSYTPVINGSTRKKTFDDNGFSLHKKKNLLDGVRKHGFHNKDKRSANAKRDREADAFSTPNTGLGLGLACPSPAVCLNPSPMRADWKQTPNGNRLKNFVTPSLLRRREKNLERESEREKNVFSAPAKSSKPRLRFGKKAGATGGGKKESDLAQKKNISSSTISIHQMAASPRVAHFSMSRNPSNSRIPRPDKLDIPPQSSPPPSKNTKDSGCVSASTITPTPNTPITDLSCDGDGESVGEGDYVRISATADVDSKDVRNEAFLGSASLSLLTDSECGTITRKNNTTGKDTTDSAFKFNTNDNYNDEEIKALELNLSPLIKEIDTLTKTAQEFKELTLSTLKGKSVSSIRSGSSRTLPKSPMEMDLDSPSSFGMVEQVETKFINAMKETKILKIQSEKKQKSAEKEKDLKDPRRNLNLNNPLHRRLSVQDRGTGVSPSQRRISKEANRRRKSHEIGRVTPVANPPPRFLSLRSPMQTMKMSSSSPSSSSKSSSSSTSKNSNSNSALKRSPTRCTLRRGRPNTTRVGLARPSPVRNTNTPRSTVTATAGVATSNQKRHSDPDPDKNEKSTSKSTVFKLVLPEPEPDAEHEDQDRDANTGTWFESGLKTPTTPIRRMSSVQELVSKLEKQRKEKNLNLNLNLKNENERKPALPPKPERSKSTLAREIATAPGPKPKPIFMSKPTPEKTPQIQTRSKTRERDAASRPSAAVQFASQLVAVAKTPEGHGDVWVPAHKFGFDRKDFRGLGLGGLRGSDRGDRDSIHFLKTSHAGKVQATAEYFNKIGKHKIQNSQNQLNEIQSPTGGKSLIPRYTALHNKTPEKVNPNAPLDAVGEEKLSRRLSSIDIRNRHEQLLENIKKERASVRRSATTAGNYQYQAGAGVGVRPTRERPVSSNCVTQNPSFRRQRPNTLEINSRTSTSPAVTVTITNKSRPASRVGSFRTPVAHNTPRILEEEDDSLTASVQKAIETLLGTDMGMGGGGAKVGADGQNSPLKSSNIANQNQNQGKNIKNAPQSQSQSSKKYVNLNLKNSPLQRRERTHRSGRDVTAISITRAISESGTKSTSTTPRTTPRIRKALTTRAYDMIGSTSSGATGASGSGTPAMMMNMTPRRRMPRTNPNCENRSYASGNGNAVTPLKASHLVTATPTPTPTPTHI